MFGINRTVTTGAGATPSPRRGTPGRGSGPDLGPSTLPPSAEMDTVLA